MAKRTLIKGGTVITVDAELGDLPEADVLIEDGEIVAVAANLAVEDADTIDASERIVMPGLVDTHRHTWQALFRNIGSDWTPAHYFTRPPGTMNGLYPPPGTYPSNPIGI